MADNVLVQNPGGTNYTTATDVIGDVHYQRVKLASGPDGTAVDVSDAAPLPVGALRAEDLLVMMSRIVKLLESNAVVDQQQRQRIAVDSIAGGLTLPTVSTLTAQTTLAGMDREMYINQACQAYALTIRNKLEFV